MKTKRETGIQGEQFAAEYLKSQGRKIVAQNVRAPFGEIDLIVEDNETLVFVEVKTRHSKKFGYPEEAVSYFKKRKLIQLAQWYLMSRRITNKRVRFDVLAIEYIGGENTCRVIQNAFEAD